MARRKPRKPARGLSYDAATRTAKISVYIKGRKGRARLRQTLHDVSLEEAEKVLVEFRARANRGSSRPPPSSRRRSGSSTTRTSTS